MGFTLAAPSVSSHARGRRVLARQPRRRYTVALGGPIMKPSSSASPISVGDDDDDDDGADAEEVPVDRTIGRSME